MATRSINSERLSSQSGYSCEFVKLPPDAIQTECPICLNILRNPQQAKCCGKCFCSSCLKKLVKKECPACKNQLSTFPDKRHRQSLDKFLVYCSHQHRGCEWSGQLGELDRHLNKNPAEGKEREGCPYAEVQCIHCEKSFERQALDNHPFDKCPKRPIRCCNVKKGCDWQGELGNLDIHLCTCKANLMSCPNSCGQNFHRDVLNEHIKKHCQMVIIECDFKHVGCNVKLPRGEMVVHITKNVNKHMLLLMGETRRLTAENVTKTEEIRKLKTKLDQTQRDKASRKKMERNVQVTSTMTRDDLKWPWLFKVSLIAVLLALTFFVFSVKWKMESNDLLLGVQDQQLWDKLKKTPQELQDELKKTAQELEKLKSKQQSERMKDMQLLERKFNEQQKKIQAIEDQLQKGIKQVTTQQNNIDSIKRGVQMLQTKQETIITAVNELKVITTDKLDRRYIGALPLNYVELTFKNYDHNKQHSDDWYSPPFYSHPRGYKMCLRVYANGNGDGEGTHVSVFIFLMKGEFDDHLKWPFRGIITVQLVDQEKDEEHHSETIDFNDGVTRNADERVMNAEINKMGWGKHMFISHDHLQPKYLKNDSLRFQITKSS